MRQLNSLYHASSCTSNTGVQVWEPAPRALLQLLHAFLQESVTGSRNHYNLWGWFSLQKVRYILWESLEMGHMTCNCSNPAKKAVVLLCVNIILLCSLKAGLCACRRLRRDLDWPTHQTTAWRVPHGIQTTSDLSPVESRDSSINVYACYSLLEY